MVRFDLTGKVALVTGASYGIGFAIASAMAEAGAVIVFNDRNQEALDRGLTAYKEAGIEAHGYICDVTDEEGVQAMVAKIEAEVGVICGHVEDPVDAYTFAHVNDGNAVAIPFAKGFGWGGELNLEYVFEKLFGFGHGQGYPPERREPEMRNKRILDEVRARTLRPLVDGLKDIDQELVKGAVAGEQFRELFFASCKDQAIADYVKGLL